MSITGDVNRVQKVHLSEICSPQIPGKSILMIIFQFLFLYHLFTFTGNKFRWLLANSCVLFYKLYGSDAWC